MNLSVSVTGIWGLLVTAAELSPSGLILPALDQSYSASQTAFVMIQVSDNLFLVRGKETKLVMIFLKNEFEQIQNYLCYSVTQLLAFHHAFWSMKRKGVFTVHAPSTGQGPPPDLFCAPRRCALLSSSSGCTRWLAKLAPLP